MGVCVCVQVLFGQMHREVLVEYVKRLFKRKVKLSDRVQQEAAANLVCRDNSRLAELFTEAVRVCHAHVSHGGYGSE